MQRRDFLAMLGLSIAGAAFNSAIPNQAIWSLPDSLLMQGKAVTPEWIAAEAVKVLCSNFDFPARTDLPSTIPSDALQQYAIDFRMDDGVERISQVEYRAKFIEPAMVHFARTLAEKKPKFFLPMTLPTSAQGHQIAHRPSGLNLRYLRVYDIGHCWTDENGVEQFTNPCFINRFDVMFA